MSYITINILSLHIYYIYNIGDKGCGKTLKADNFTGHEAQPYCSICIRKVQNIGTTLSRTGTGRQNSDPSDVPSDVVTAPADVPTDDPDYSVDYTTSPSPHRDVIRQNIPSFGTDLKSENNLNVADNDYTQSTPQREGHGVLLVPDTAHALSPLAGDRDDAHHTPLHTGPTESEVGLEPENGVSKTLFETEPPIPTNSQSSSKERILIPTLSFKDTTPTQATTKTAPLTNVDAIKEESEIDQNSDRLGRLDSQSSHEINQGLGAGESPRPTESSNRSVKEGITGRSRGPDTYRSRITCKTNEDGDGIEEEEEDMPDYILTARDMSEVDLTKPFIASDGSTPTGTYCHIYALLLVLE